MRKLIKISLVLVGIVILLLVTEYGLRLFGIKPGVYIVHRLNPYDFDSNFGWMIRKNSSYLRISPEYLHYNYYNSQGLPTSYKNKDQILDPKSPKIALLGNSLVESYYLPYEKSFPYLIDRKINSLEVLNLGVSGYTPGQYLLQARQYLKNFNVQMVVVFFVPFQDIKYLNNPVFPGGFAKPVFNQNLSTPMNTPLQEYVPRRKLQLEDYSSLITLLQPVLNQWFGYVNRYYDMSITESDVDFSTAEFSDALRYFKEIHNEWDPSKEFYVMYIPSEFEYQFPRVLSSNLERFSQSCSQLNLNCKVPDFFQDPKEDYRLFYYKKDHHPSPYGARKMADFLTDYLNKRSQ